MIVNCSHKGCQMGFETDGDMNQKYRIALAKALGWEYKMGKPGYFLCPAHRTGTPRRVQNNEDKAPLFLANWELFGDNKYPIEAEYRFHPSRRWRFDFAFPDLKIAIETDGGGWSPYGGRHNRDSDREKLNHAAAAGWVVFRFSPDMLNKDPQGCIDLVLQALALRGG